MELTRYLKMAWDTVANEYYLELHRTSRNFDTLISNFLPRMMPNLCSDSLYLDLGGGSGKLKELYKSISSNVVVADISKVMMKTKTDSSDSMVYIQMDAFNMPFRANTFDGIFSLLGDSYALREAFEEVLRVLKLDGFFLIALPTKLWAKNLRPFLGIKINETVFTTQDGKLIKIPSFVYDSKDLQRILLSVGFKKVKTGEWRPLNLIPRERFSKDVLTAARNLDMPPEDFPLITYALACKSDVKRITVKDESNSNELEKLPLDEWVEIFYEKARKCLGKQLEGFSPSDIWLRSIENAGTRIAEFIRREEYTEAIKSLGEAFGWLCCFVKKCLEHYKIHPISKLVWDKYPGMCYACADKIAEDDVVKKDYASCICPGMKGISTNIEKSKMRLEYARNNKKKAITLDDWADMIKSIYKEVHSILPISAICLHFIEEVGEVTRELYEYTTLEKQEAAEEKLKEKIKKLEEEIADTFSWILGLMNKIDQLFNKARAYYDEKKLLSPLKASEIAREALETFSGRT